MQKGFLCEMFVFRQFLFMKQTYPVFILRRPIAGPTHFFFFSEITFFFFFFRPMRDIPALKLNDAHLLFEGKHLPSLKSYKSFFTQLSSFLNRINVHCCQLQPTYSLKELLPFKNTID